MIRPLGLFTHTKNDSGRLALTLRAGLNSQHDWNNHSNKVITSGLEELNLRVMLPLEDLIESLQQSHRVWVGGT